MEKVIELESGAKLIVSAREIGQNILTTSYVEYPDGTKSGTTCTCTCDGTSVSAQCDDGMDATCDCTGSTPSISC